MAIKANLMRAHHYHYYWRHWLPGIALLLLGLGLQAQTPAATPYAPPAHPLLAWKPQAAPDRLLMLPAANGTRGFTISWRSAATTPQAVLEIVPAQGLQYAWSSKKKVTAHTKMVRHPYADSAAYHQASVQDLEPGQSYLYRVGQPPYWSAWQHYTQPAANDTVRLLYFGDAQNGIYTHAKSLYEKAARHYPNADLVLHAGDLINHAENDYEWAEWYAASASINTTQPVLAAPGNHEYLKNEAGKKTGIASHWPATFTYPSQAADTLTAHQYFVDYKHIRLIVLNSNEQLTTQAAWLEDKLKTAGQRWVILMFHHPVFSGARGRINEGVQQHWLPLIEKYKVPLVLQGHDHTYARGGLPQQVTGNLQRPTAPVFVLSVAGTKRYPLEVQPWMHTSYADVSSYQSIEVAGHTLRYHAWSHTGQLIDYFELQKEATPAP